MESSASQPVIKIEKIEADDTDEVANFYRRILLPHFPADQLETVKSFTAGLKCGGTSAFVGRAADGVIIGGAVGDLFPQSNVMLLSYLAVPREGRGTGIGGLLLKHVTELWDSQIRPSLIVTEVEDPRYYHSDVDQGDPEARVRFYERLGARALPVPYFQPALGSRGPSARRVPHLMLMVLGGTAAPPEMQQVDGQIVERFLIEYIQECEGPVRPDDAEAERMLAACRRPDGLPLLRASELPASIS